MGEERLPQRVMFGELVGGKGYSGGQENGAREGLVSASEGGCLSLE